MLFQATPRGTNSLTRNICVYYPILWRKCLIFYVLRCGSTPHLNPKFSISEDPSLAAPARAKKQWVKQNSLFLFLEQSDLAEPGAAVAAGGCQGPRLLLCGCFTSSAGCSHLVVQCCCSSCCCFSTTRKGEDHGGTMSFIRDITWNWHASLLLTPHDARNKPCGHLQFERSLGS